MEGPKTRGYSLRTRRSLAASAVKGDMDKENDLKPTKKRNQKGITGAPKTAMKDISVVDVSNNVRRTRSQLKAGIEESTDQTDDELISASKLSVGKKKTQKGRTKKKSNETSAEDAPKVLISTEINLLQEKEKTECVDNVPSEHKNIDGKNPMDDVQLSQSKVVNNCVSTEESVVENEDLSEVPIKLDVPVPVLEHLEKDTKEVGNGDSTKTAVVHEEIVTHQVSGAIKFKFFEEN